jgi:uracil-DNA glycosylase
MGKLTAMREANRIRSAAGPAARVLLVGELNPYGGPDSNALVPWPNNCAGARLQSRILGLPEEVYLAMHRRNLCRGTWSIVEARAAAWACLSATTGPHPWTTIVMLGQKVRAAFARYQMGFSLTADVHMEPFTTRTAQGVTLVALPHPSGRNAASWGDAAVHRARKMLAELEPEIPWGSLPSRSGGT